MPRVRRKRAARKVAGEVVEAASGVVGAASGVVGAASGVVGAASGVPIRAHTRSSTATRSTASPSTAVDPQTPDAASSESPWSGMDLVRADLKQLRLESQGALQRELRAALQALQRESRSALEELQRESRAALKELQAETGALKQQLGDLVAGKELPALVSPLFSTASAPGDPKLFQLVMHFD